MALWHLGSGSRRLSPPEG